MATPAPRTAVVADGASSIDWVQLASGILLPSAAIIISALIAVSIARWERKSAELARVIEREDRVIEQLLTTLLYFQNGPFGTFDWDRESARLTATARMMLTGSTPSEFKEVGQWLTQEVLLFHRLVIKAMKRGRWLPLYWRTIRPLRRYISNDAREWAAYVESIIGEWTVGRVPPNYLHHRYHELVAGKVKPGDELIWLRETYSKFRQRIPLENIDPHPEQNRKPKKRTRYAG